VKGTGFSPYIDRLHEPGLQPLRERSSGHRITHQQRRSRFAVEWR
jgi:hypothetical protein